MKETDNLKGNKRFIKYNKIKLIRNFKYQLYKIIIIINCILLQIYINRNKNVINNKISVIIPTYNRAKQLIRSLRSVLSQTYNNIEVIIVDDNSSDDTKKRIDKINDNRIKYIKLKKNKGPGYARNIGIRYSNGQFIAFQDSDDIFHKDKLEKQFRNLKRFNSDLDFCKICLNLNDSYKVFIPSIEQEKKIFKNEIKNQLLYGNFISTQSILVKKNIIENYMFDYNLPRLLDYDLVLRMATNEVKFSYTQRVLVELIRYNDSIGVSSSKLLNAKNILYNKTYNFNSNEVKIFVETLKIIQRT